MHPLPHRYSVAATAGPQGEVALDSPGLPPLGSAPPAEFDGPGTHWSPETLLSAAVADCVVLTFRALARNRLPFLTLQCNVEGTLDRVDRLSAFTTFRVRARLRVPAGTSVPEAERLLLKAKATCLITNSLNATTEFEFDVVTEPASLPEPLSLQALA